jgi:hypothetical protein
MTKTNAALLDDIEKLRTLPVAQLRARYLELFGEETTSRNKDYLFKRIAYRMQEKKYGGLTLRARERAAILAEDAPIRRRLSPSTDAAEVVRLPPPTNRDPRLPPPGTELRRTFDGIEHIVTVLEDGFAFRGKPYKSLSIIAREITGTRWNGFGFFGLLRKESA